MQPVFTGIGVALATMFDEGGGVDVRATSDHAARLVELGVSAVIVSGTTGEPMSLARSERVAIIEAVRLAVPGVPVIAGTGAPSTREALALTADAIAAGADSVLALSPPGPVDVTAYYQAVVGGAGSTPVLAYHFPTISAPGFSPEALPDFGVVGVKDSSGDPKRLFQILDGFDGAVYPGSPYLVATASAHGAAGAILAIANLAPEDAVEAFEGNVDAQRRLAATQSRLVGNRWGALKGAMAERFGTSPRIRMG